jgi:hypothetical protein
VQFCIAMLEAASQKEGRPGADKADPFRDRILAALGLNQQVIAGKNNELGGGDWGNHVRRLASQAAVMALVVEHGRQVLEPIQGPFSDTNKPVPKNLIDALNNQEIGLLRIKTKHVQDYIDRAVKQYLRRGASSWCAQMLASVRDWCVETRIGVPIVDADAVCTLVTRPNLPATEVRDLFKSWLDHMWCHGEKAGALHAYPRLAPRLLELPDWCDPLTCLPTLDLLSIRNTNLLALCQTDDPLDQAALEARKRELESTGDLCVLVPPETAPHSDTQPCSKVSGDFVVTEQTPPWHEDKGKPEPQGWLSWVWSPGRQHCQAALHERDLRSPGRPLDARLRPSW